MKLAVSTTGLFLSFVLFGASEGSMTKQEYVEKWKSVAVEQMLQHRVPASITLAQGILESGSGNSRLAREGNNHFGIKCHGWTGRKMYKDDDKKDECFRAYDSAESSYRDHSLFLTSRSRYAKLFTYEVTDYKSWAYGLKKAGYATNPKYPKLLIQLIEELELYKLDELENETVIASTSDELKEIDDSEWCRDEKHFASTTPHIENKTVLKHSSKHTVYKHTNKVNYIITKKGDTYYRIANEFGLSLNQLNRYNDFPKHKDVLIPGDIVYVQPKRRKNRKAKEVIVEEEKSLIEIAQEKGVKLKSLMKLNNTSSEDAVVASGGKVTLK